MFCLNFIVILLVTAQVAVSKGDFCQEVTGKSFDLNKFVGDWYVIETTEANSNGVSRCGQFKVEKQSESTFRIYYNGINVNNQTINFDIKGMVDGGVTESWTIVQAGKIIDPVRQVIVDGNYDSHLAISFCVEKDMENFGRDIMMIWSRQKQLDPVIVESLKQNFPAMKKLFFKVNENC